MKVFLSPQVSDDKPFEFIFEGEVLTVRQGDLKEVFDFTGLPDGAIEMHDEKGQELIKTVFEVNPLLNAVKEDGVLYITLLNRIGVDATEEERFPEWIDAKDYQAKEV